MYGLNDNKKYVWIIVNSHTELETAISNQAGLDQHFLQSLIT